MQLRTRLESGGTPTARNWGIDSEYGRLRHVLVGPIDHFIWQPGNAVAQRSERVGLRFDFKTARAQYGEMLDAYRQAGVEVHILPPSPELVSWLKERGIRVIPVPYEDAMRLGGAVHCMCQALRRDPGAR